MKTVNFLAFSQLITQTTPVARAILMGNNGNTRLRGTINFYPAGNGTLVAAEVVGLPRTVLTSKGEAPAGPFYAFHIHEGSACGSGAGDNPFSDAGNHYNPTQTTHPGHAGDMPPLLADKGYAYATFFTSRFTPDQVIGRTVVVHQNPDDFHTQPSGNAGQKIACGPIQAVAAPLYSQLI